MKPINYMILVIVFCIATAGSFWVGAYSRDIIITHLRADLIRVEKAHKESLRKEAEYLDRLNDAFTKTVEIERFEK